MSEKTEGGWLVYEYLRDAPRPVKGAVGALGLACMAGFIAAMIWWGDFRYEQGKSDGERNAVLLEAKYERKLTALENKPPKVMGYELRLEPPPPPEDLPPKDVEWDLIEGENKAGTKKP